MSEKRLCPAGHEYWWPAAQWMHRDCLLVTPLVTNPDVTNQSVTNNDAPVVTNRMTAWREKNREKNNAYQRDLMRKRRAK